MKNSTDCLITQHYNPGQEMQLVTGHAQNKNKNYLFQVVMQKHTTINTCKINWHIYCIYKVGSK